MELFPDRVIVPQVSVYRFIRLSYMIRLVLHDFYPDNCEPIIRYTLASASKRVEMLFFEATD